MRGQGGEAHLFSGTVRVITGGRGSLKMVERKAGVTCSVLGSWQSLSNPDDAGRWGGGAKQRPGRAGLASFPCMGPQDTKS
jgi:hypothetical protein